MKIRGAKVFEIFRKGSRTYFLSSLFFPHRERCDVFRVYAFVRVVDNFVDTKPQKLEELKHFLDLYRKAEAGEVTGNEVIDEFNRVVVKENIKREWINDFIQAMKSDIGESKYKTLKELEEYMYGSAEVIGLFMAKVLRLPKESYESARTLGKAMQLANFIRDIEEDNYLGRQYIPDELIKKHGLNNLSRSEVVKKKSNFISLIRECVGIYRDWQKSAEDGFIYISRRNLVPVRVASDMYKWTMDQIYQNPMIIFKIKLKPSKARVITSLVKYSIAV